MHVNFLSSVSFTLILNRPLEKHSYSVTTIRHCIQHIIFTKHGYILLNLNW